MGTKNEKNDDVFYFEFTGGKENDITENWDSDQWAEEISYLRNLPMKKDIINFNFVTDNKILAMMKENFGSTLFIVIRREVIFMPDRGRHHWDIYIKPYFKDNSASKKYEE